MHCLQIRGISAQGPTSSGSLLVGAMSQCLQCAAQQEQRFRQYSGVCPEGVQNKQPPGIYSGSVKAERLSAL